MSEKKPKLGLCLFGIFGLLIVSVIIALYAGATEEKQQSAPIAGQVTVKEMQDYLNKMNRVIGERSLEDAAGREALKQTASMIEGTLGTMNLGYDVSQSMKQQAKGLLWKTLWIDTGNALSNEVVLLEIPYGESGTPVALSLGFAEYLVEVNFERKVRIAFTPPVNTISLEERLLAEGETVVRKIDLRGDGGEPHWGEVSAGKLAEIVMADASWKEKFKVNTHEEMTMRVGERGALSSRGFAAQLIKIFPVLTQMLKD